MGVEVEREDSPVSSLGGALFSFQVFLSAMLWLGVPVLLLPFFHQLPLIIWSLLTGLSRRNLYPRQGHSLLLGGLRTAPCFFKVLNTVYWLLFAQRLSSPSEKQRRRQITDIEPGCLRLNSTSVTLQLGDSGQII